MTKKKDVMRPALWTPRPVDETIAIYADWAATYDDDLGKRGYHTPTRIADALKAFAKPDDPVLDFGCGTGLSGAALKKAGFKCVDGTDVTAEMLEQASASGLYAKTWLSQPGQLSFGRGVYQIICAAGVISLGAAPPDTLAALMAKLNPGNLLALSFNDPTLADDTYIEALADEVSAGRGDVIFREHGRHLDDVEMGSDVIILRRR